ncbi:MAG: DedA family protein [Phycisphaerales bacterium]|nr:DedA family protein [Phycisphaerales bacterium]
MGFVEEFLREYQAVLPLIVFMLLMASAVGIPIGEDPVNIAAGIIIGEASMGPNALGPEVWVPTLIASWAGVTTADIIWFMLCYHFGNRLLHRRRVRRALHPRRLLQVKHQIDQRGVWAIVAARFVPGGRTPVITVAGLMHLKRLHFCLATWGCVLLTAPMQLGFGVLVGRGLASRDGFAVLEWSIAGGVLIAVAVFMTLIVRRLRREGAPRARMRWLRKQRSTTTP